MQNHLSHSFNPRPPHSYVQPGSLQHVQGAIPMYYDEDDLYDS